jgi:hypothetical protein
MLRTGHASEIYDYDSEERFEEMLAPTGRHYVLPINHPAFEELLFVPLSLLSYKAAYWVFMACNGGLLVLCARLLGGRLRVLPEESRWGPGRWAPALLLLAFFPIARTLENGQDSIIMLALLAGAMGALDGERDFVAGLLVGAGIFKFQIVLPVALLFVVWRRWRFSAGFAVSAVSAGLISLGLVGLDAAREYGRTLFAMSVGLTAEADMFRYGTHPAGMMNLRGLFSAALGGTLPHSYVEVLIAVGSVAVLAAAGRQRPSFPLAIAAAGLVSYHFIVHDATILIIVIAAALGSGLLWDSAVAILVFVAPLWAIIPDRGYLAAIPLLGLFLLMLGRWPGNSVGQARGVVASP